MSLSSTRSGERDHDAVRAPAAALTPGELAWVLALPCALLTLAAVVVLGPPLGDLSQPGGQLWPLEAHHVYGTPEPVKRARYALALLGAVALAALVLVGARRPVRLPHSATSALVVGSQLLTCVALVVATLAQRDVIYQAPPVVWRVFSTPSLVVACLLAVALAAALRVPLVARAVTRGAGGRAWDVAGLAVAALATVLWLLPALATEHTAANGPFPDLPLWAMADTYAILDGRTPLADYHAVYGQLWAYVAAGPMAALGATIDVFTTTMVIGSALGLLAVYATFRRLARGAALALVLYLPFLATSLYEVAAIEIPWRVSNAAVYSVWPMRYAGPFVLAWLTARQLGGARPRSAFPLGLLGGLVVVNNLEFGLAGFAGTAVALACAPAYRSWRALGRLAGALAGGALTAALLVALLTLVRSGSLPHFGFLLEFPRVFGSLGFVSLPMAAIGFHLVLYITFAAALAVAAVRLARRADDVLLTGLLAWSGVFGLLAGSYYTGRSDPIKLAALFPAWGFALALLLVVVARGLVRQGWRVPGPAELAVLVGWGLAICSLAQLQSPGSEIDRLRAGGAPATYEAPQERSFVDRHTAPDEPVTILFPMGHRVAYDLGMTNVAPYGSMEMMATREQLDTVLDAMREEGAHKLFLPVELTARAHVEALARAGFARRAREGRVSYWSDGAAG